MLEVFAFVMDKLDDSYLRREQKDQDIEEARAKRESMRNAGKTKTR